jgi:hypothetical protein
MTILNALLPIHKISLLQVNSCHYSRGFWYVSFFKNYASAAQRYDVSNDVNGSDKADWK